MNRSHTLRRRKFIQAAAGAAASGSVISCGRSRSQWRFFTDSEAKTVTAICERIIPADQDPGAAWAGAPVFIDLQLTKYYKDLQSAYRSGIAAVEQTAQKMHGKGFIEISAQQQTGLLALLEKNKAPAGLWKGIEPREFFNMVVEHTMQGFYGGPRHGGNRDAVSWKMLQVPEPPLRGREQYEFVKEA